MLQLGLGELLLDLAVVVDLELLVLHGTLVLVELALVGVCLAAKASIVVEVLLLLLLLVAVVVLQTCRVLF